MIIDSAEERIEFDKQGDNCGDGVKCLIKIVALKSGLVDFLTVEINHN